MRCSAKRFPNASASSRKLTIKVFWAARDDELKAIFLFICQARRRDIPAKLQEIQRIFDALGSIGANFTPPI
jgi:hypothetical protein